MNTSTLRRFGWGPAIAVLAIAAIALFVFLPTGARAQDTLQVRPFELTSTAGANATWSTDFPSSGSFSAHLVTTGDVNTGRTATIVIQASDVGITTLDDLNSMSWAVREGSGYAPHVDVMVDTGSGTDALVFEYAKVDPNQCDDSADYPVGDYNTFDDKGVVDADAYAWLGSGPAGPCGVGTFDANHMSLADWKSTGTAGIDGSTPVLRLELEVDNWIEQSGAYVDEITINGVTYYGLIQDAVDTALAGDTVAVGAGTYLEDVTVDKALTLSGAQVGVDGRGARGAESTVGTTTGAFSLEADSIVVDGFHLTGVTTCAAGAIFTSPAFSGYEVRNNVIENNETGMRLSSEGTTPTIVERNLFRDNDLGVGSCTGDNARAILSASPGDVVRNATIDNNRFEGHDEGGNSSVMNFGLGDTHSDVTISNNEVTDTSIVIGNATGFVVENNSLMMDDGDSSTALFISGSVHDLTVTGNTIAGEGRGIWVAPFDFGGLTASSTFVVTGNQIINNTTAGIEVADGRYTGDMDAQNNTFTGNGIGVDNQTTATPPSIIDARFSDWGHTTGPGSANGPVFDPVTGAEADGQGDTVTENVRFDPWTAGGSVTKTSSPELIGPGETLTYEVTVTNEDDEIPAHVTMTDPLPAEVTFASVDAPGGWTCTTPAVGAGGTVECSTDTLAAGATETVVIEVTVEDVPDGTVIENTATITVPGAESDAGTSATASSTVSRAELILTKDAPEQVEAGHGFTYTLTVDNDSPRTAANTILEDDLPAGLDLVSIDAPTGVVCSETSGVVTCDLGDFAGGDIATISLHVNAPAFGMLLVNEADVETTTPEGSLANNVASTETLVVVPRDVPEQPAGPPPVQPTATPTSEPDGPTITDTGIEVTVEGEETTTVEDGEAASVGTDGPNGSVQVDAPAGALPDGTTILVAAASDPDDLADQAPPPPGADLLAGFIVQAFDENGDPVEGPFDPPVTLTFTVDADALPEGATVDTIVLAFWNGDQWIEVEAEVTEEPDGSFTITASVMHLTIFGIFHQPRVTYDLAFRWTNIAWLGIDDMPVEVALEGTGFATGGVGEHVTVVWAWHASTQTWTAYFTSAPAGINDLDLLEADHAYWVAIDEANGAEWTVAAE